MNQIGQFTLNHQSWEIAVVFQSGLKKCIDLVHSIRLKSESLECSSFITE